MSGELNFASERRRIGKTAFCATKCSQNTWKIWRGHRKNGDIFANKHEPQAKHGTS